MAADILDIIEVKLDMAELVLEDDELEIALDAILIIEETALIALALVLKEVETAPDELIAV